MPETENTNYGSRTLRVSTVDGCRVFYKVEEFIFGKRFFVVIEYNSKTTIFDYHELLTAELYNVGAHAFQQVYPRAKGGNNVANT